MLKTKQTETSDTSQVSQKTDEKQDEKSVFHLLPDTRNLSKVPHQLRAHTIKPGEIRNPGGMKKNPFNLQARCRELGPKMQELLVTWAESADFRASLPAIRMILATGFPEFEKALTSPNDVPPGFENLSIAQRLDALRARRAELKQAEENVRAGGNENAVADFTENSKVTSATSVPRGTINNKDAGVSVCASAHTDAPTRAGEKSAK